MKISDRLMDILESTDQMTEMEISQNIGLCEEDIIEGLEDITKALRILSMIRKGDAKGLVSIKYGF